ncbi:response regulator transcription factor [Pollutibacter soli]|uniref:response regulator transcription factor n=1 Tax=Pollutibacter soli TaxID=3034157 RepID=UPI0030139AFA
MKILLVEDEVRIADTLKFGLGEFGYKVITAHDGNAGLELFHSEVFDLVILDINLPGINGIDLCKLIREKDAHTPVIMLTAMSTIEDKVLGYDAGADDYIIKPFEFKELVLKIRAIFRRGLQAAVTVNKLYAGDLTMDLDTKEVSRAGDNINLTVKEFQLLEYLVRNKNKVLSRAEIAINVWEIDFDTNTNIIDVYINYIRNKVDKPYPNKLIQTHIGIGYILKEN